MQTNKDGCKDSPEFNNEKLSTDPSPQHDDLEDESKYPGPVPTFLIFLSLAVATFICGFDTNCVATIIPLVTDTFHSLTSTGWYAASYLLASASSQLFYGRLYSLLPAKPVFACVLLCFLAGSLLCALAPTSAVFILGRAVSGLGSAGMLAGTNIILSRVLPLRRRPLALGCIGALECVAISVGPLLGGTVARYLGWRWCFWLCMPVSGAALVVTMLFFKVEDADEARGLSTREKLAQMDYTGAVFFLPGIVCLIMALQWGGAVYPWGNWRVILLLVLFVVLIVVFAYTQWRQGDKATIPPSILLTRTVLFGSLYSFNTAGALYVVSYYLQIWFQTIKSRTPFQSGVDGLPLVAALTLAVLLSGLLTTLLRRHHPTMCLGTLLMALGAGHLTTLRIHTPVPRWAAYQVLFALGCGLGFQQPLVATQTAFSPAQLPAALVVVAFMQTLGGIVAVSAAQNVFSNRLLADIRGAAPGIDADVIRDSGILGLKAQFTEEQLRVVLPAYNRAITQVLTISVAMACVTAIGAVGTPWRPLKSRQKIKQGKYSEKLWLANNRHMLSESVLV